MLSRNPLQRLTPDTLPLRTSLQPRTQPPPINPPHPAIIRLQMPQQPHLPDLQTMRGRKSRVKDIVEIRRRIKKLDHSLNRYEQKPSEPASQENKLEKYYEKLVVEYIRNNPEIDNGKKIIVCRPFRVRHQGRVENQRVSREEEEEKQQQQQGEVVDRDRVSRQIQFRPLRRKHIALNKQLEVGEIDEFMNTRMIDIKPSTAQTISLMSTTMHRPIFAYATYNSMTIDQKAKPVSRAARDTITSLGHRPQQQSLPKRNDFKLEGWADANDTRQEVQFSSAYLIE